MEEDKTGFKKSNSHAEKEPKISPLTIDYIIPITITLIITTVALAVCGVELGVVSFYGMLLKGESGVGRIFGNNTHAQKI